MKAALAVGGNHYSGADLSSGTVKMPLGTEVGGLYQRSVVGFFFSFTHTIKELKSRASASNGLIYVVFPPFSLIYVGSYSVQVIICNNVRTGKSMVRCVSELLLSR